MKIITNDNEQNKAELSQINQEQALFRKNLTNFWISLLALLVEVCLLWLTLWLLTSPEIAFSPLITTNVGVGIGLSLLCLTLVFITTNLGFWLKLHQADQFTFNAALSGVIMAYYLCGFWWTNSNFLYQTLVAAAFLFVMLLLGTACSVLMKNLRLKFQTKKEAKVTKKVSIP